MSKALYDNLEGLRFWNEEELELRDSIVSQIASTVNRTIRDVNQMWRITRVEAPIMMPANLMSGSYTRDDVFFLQDAPGGTNDYVLRPETTNGTYEMAAAILKAGEIRAPFGIYQVGPSFRRETSDGATAAKLRFNQFIQQEFQMIYSADTKVDLVTVLRDALKTKIENITGLETRLIDSDRLPSYSEETVDIEVLTPSGEWREIASTSRRNDCPQIPGSKELKNFEMAFGIDRLVVLTMASNEKGD